MRQKKNRSLFKMFWNDHYFEVLTSNSCYSTTERQEENDSSVSIVN